MHLDFSKVKRTFYLRLKFVLGVNQEDSLDFEETLMAIIIYGHEIHILDS